MVEQHPFECLGGGSGYDVQQLLQVSCAALFLLVPIGITVTIFLLVIPLSRVSPSFLSFFLSYSQTRHLAKESIICLIVVFCSSSKVRCMNVGEWRRVEGASGVGVPKFSNIWRKSSNLYGRFVLAFYGSSDVILVLYGRISFDISWKKAFWWSMAE